MNLDWGISTLLKEKSFKHWKSCISFTVDLALCSSFAKFLRLKWKREERERERAGRTFPAPRLKSWRRPLSRFDFSKSNPCWSNPSTQIRILNIQMSTAKYKFRSTSLNCPFRLCSFFQPILCKMTRTFSAPRPTTSLIRWRGRKSSTTLSTRDSTTGRTGKITIFHI